MSEQRFKDRPRTPHETVRNEQWEDLTNVLPPSLPRPPLAYRQAWDWSLVLKATEIPHNTNRSGFGWRIHVPESHLDEAVSQIQKYEHENQKGVESAPIRPPGFETGWTTMLVLVCAFLLNAITGHQINAFDSWLIPWDELGLADSGLMRHGEWWRSVTALTLHADAAHFVSNAVIGGIFIYLLSREIKSGPAWLLFIASGFLGNMINAWARGPGHLSLGASTGVFGIVAAITAFRVMQNKRLDLKNTLVPCAAGLAILGLLGTAGERTDVLAHLFGFLSGLPLGALTGLAVKAFGPPREAVNKLTGFLAAYVPFYAWTRALQGFEPNPLSFF